MPTSEAPTEVNEPKGPAAPDAQTGGSAQETSITGSILGLDTFSARDLEPRQEVSPLEPGEAADGAASHAARGSRWLDYDTHELLEMISELEDERRWARLREGVLWAVLVHITLLFCLYLIPKYVLKVPRIDDFDAIKQRQDLTYLDLPPDALRELNKPKVRPKLPPNKPLIDKQTMDEMKKQAPPPPAPAQQQSQTPEQPKPQPTQPLPPNPQSQAPEAPRPQAVPAKPNFAMGPQNPADQLRQDMQKAMHGQGQGYGNQPSGGSGLARHPGAGSGFEVLSDTQGVDFSSWLSRWHYITQMTWDPLIPDEVNPPILKSGIVAVRFKVLPNGQVTDMQLDGRSGDTGLDRAAWGAITGSSYPPLPREFHGPYLELRAYFLYNEKPQ
ncbi:MAG TPA: TonB family protein [Terracidiphilus sp.]|nr:TonB family protein [Terracidiphilus sp.]